MQMLLYGEGLEGLRNRVGDQSVWNSTRKVRMPQRRSKSYLTSQAPSELFQFHLSYDDKPTWNVLCSRLRLSYLCCQKVGSWVETVVE